jgi:hypothetical protein
MKSIIFHTKFSSWFWTNIPVNFVNDGNSNCTIGADVCPSIYVEHDEQ